MLSKLHCGMSSSWDGELATLQTFYQGLTNSTRETLDAAAGGAFLSLTILAAIAIVEKMASNQGWNEEHLQTHKRGGCMHQLKEVDMLSAKMDLLMKKLEDRANEKKEVMHIHDSRMACEVWKHWAFKEQLS